MKILRVKQQDGTLVDIPFGVSNSSSDIATHNTDASAHSDIRNAIAELKNTVDDISNGNGFENVNLAVQNITINGKTIQEIIKEYVDEAILGGEW